MGEGRAVEGPPRWVCREVIGAVVRDGIRSVLAEGVSPTLVERVYLAEMTDRQRRFAATFVDAPDWHAGLTRSIDWMLADLSGDPEFAWFAGVEIPSAEHLFDDVRTCVRARALAMWESVYRTHWRTETAPRLHLELLSGAITHAIIDVIVTGRVVELPELRDALVALAGDAHDGSLLAA